MSDKFKLKTIEISENQLDGLLDLIYFELETRFFDTFPPISQMGGLFIVTGVGGIENLRKCIFTKFGPTAIVLPDDLFANQGQYEIPILGRLLISHNPQLDNLRINGILKPGSYFPISSFSYDIYFAGVHVLTIKLKFPEL